MLEEVGQDAALLVVGSRGASPLTRFLLGSVSHQLVTAAGFGLWILTAAMSRVFTFAADGSGPTALWWQER